MKQVKWMACVLLFFVGMLLQGCATPDKPFAIRNMECVSSIKVVRYDSPQLIKRTVASQAVGLTGVMFGAIGGALGGAISAGMESYQGKCLAEQCNLPEFGKLVMHGFVERIPQELPQWPALSVVDEPVGDDFTYGSGYLLAIDVKYVKVENWVGFETSTVGKMMDPGNQVVWQKSFTYKPEEYTRCCKLSELEADNGKLLREEFLFAADKTVSSFIEHLKSTRSNQDTSNPTKTPEPAKEPSDIQADPSMAALNKMSIADP